MPLRFISELDPENITSTALPRSEEELSRSDLGQRENQDPISNKMTAIAKQVLLENGLSVTALNHFLECPNKFLYLSILKLPQAPSPAAEKESVKKDLFDDALVVAKALEQHFNVGSQAAIFTERWAKTIFEGGISKPELGNVSIPLHGKLDAIVDKGGELDVFDYKTREGMSVNEIKGETKNSTGDYFRQLVFYRILLADEPRWKSKKITPALVFISPDKKGRCPIVALPISPEDIEKAKQEIQSVIDSVWSGELVRSKCGDLDCEWCALAKVSFS
jgi:DNA helicase-2/ATP-dependent DNA helicase PcrA